MASRHHRTRRLGLCFAVLLVRWRSYRDKQGQAMRFHALQSRGLQTEVFAAWRELIGLLKWKNIRRRR